MVGTRELKKRAKAIFLEELKSSGIDYDTYGVWIYPSYIKTVGVMGDERTLERVAELKILKDNKFVYEQEFLEKVSRRIVNEVPGVNRVTYFLEEEEIDNELKELGERENTSEGCFVYNLKKYMEKI